jgi:hypothetical protein
MFMSSCHTFHDGATERCTFGIWAALTCLFANLYYNNNTNNYTSGDFTPWESHHGLQERLTAFTQIDLGRVGTVTDPAIR